MKRLSLLLLVLTVAVGTAFPQARVFNATDYKVTISQPSGLEKVIINPRSTSFVHFLPSSGIAEFSLGRYEGLKEVKIGIAKRQVTKGNIALKDFSLEAEKVAEKQEKQEKKVPEKIVPAPVSSDDWESETINASGWWAETTVVPKNESDVRIVVLAGPFKGLALKTGQASKKSKTLKTGEYVFPVYFDQEADSVSTGRQYKWSVIDKIVVEEQDTFRITNADLQQVSSGKQVIKPVKNNLAVDFLVVAGQNAGKVIPANNMLALDLYVGWNVIPVQYKGKDGLPVQAVLLLMINELKKPLIADRKSGGNSISIDPANLILTGR